MNEAKYTLIFSQCNPWLEIETKISVYFAASNIKKGLQCVAPLKKQTVSIFIIGLGLMAAANVNAALKDEICVLNKIDNSKFPYNQLSVKIVEDHSNGYTDDAIHYLEADYYSNLSCITAKHVVTLSQGSGLPRIKFSVSGTYSSPQNVLKKRAFSIVNCSHLTMKGIDFNSRVTAVITANDDGDLICNIETNSTI